MTRRAGYLIGRDRTRSEESIESRSKRKTRTMMLSKFFCTLVSIFAICAALLSTSVHANKLDDFLYSLLDGIRSDHQQHRDVASQGLWNLDEVAELGGPLMKAFAPILRDENRDENSTAIPPIRFLSYAAEEEEEAKDSRNLLEGEEELGTDEEEKTDHASAAAFTAGQGMAQRIGQRVGQRMERIGSRIESIGSAMDSEVVKTWVSMAHKLIQRWPIWVDGIWMQRGSSLGGGTCTFDFESHKNFKYLPLQWKMTDANCGEFPKSDIRDARNRWCVKFKLFQYVSFTHCAPSEYWRLLVQGDIISVNPTNGATVIDAANLIQSGGLDQFLPLRSALGQGGVLDLLNYL